MKKRGIQCLSVLYSMFYTCSHYNHPPCASIGPLVGTFQALHGLFEGHWDRADGFIAICGKSSAPPSRLRGEARVPVCNHIRSRQNFCLVSPSFGIDGESELLYLISSNVVDRTKLQVPPQNLFFKLFRDVFERVGEVSGGT